MIFGGNRRRGAAVCVAVLLIMMVWRVQGCFAVDASEAGEAIRQAERDLTAAYVKVAEAAGVGADVSVLLNELNSAGTYLSRANAAFKAGDYDSASVLAADCSNSVKGVASEAENLESYAQGVRSNTIFSAVFVSVFGVVFVIFLGFVGWEFLKRRHFRGILDKKPKLVDFCEL
jgi:hypothetical protein